MGGGYNARQTNMEKYTEMYFDEGNIFKDLTLEEKLRLQKRN